MSVTKVATRRLIAYFRDCLLEDGSDRQIRDVFGRDEREQFLFPCSCEQWVPSAPVLIPADYAERVTSVLQLQPQERELVLGTCLVSGAFRTDGQRPRRVRAPLFLFGTELVEQDGQNAVRIEPDSLRLNPVALDALGLTLEQLGGSPESPNWVRLQQQLETIQRRDPIANSADWPRWRSAQAPFWIESGVVWVTARSMLARSVAYELSELADGQQTLSAPLRRILGSGSVSSRPGDDPLPETLPVSVTAAQERCLHNAASATLSVVNGPPGTGKTYALACQTIDRVLRNERVLIVCGNEHAADVVRGKIAELFPEAEDMLLRAGRGNHRQQLLERLDKLLSGQIKPRQGKSHYELAQSLGQRSHKYHQEEKRFRAALAEECAEAEAWRGASSRFWGRFRRWRLRRRVFHRPLLIKLWRQLRQAVKEHQQLAQDHLAALAANNLRRLLRDKRPQLSALVRALRSRASGHREARFDALNWDVLTQAFPIWIVSAQALHRALPLEAELFDLVILDEATQCNLPLALPALQRASRAVIVGDPRQLRHFSFLARARQNVLAERHDVSRSDIDLDYRERSLLDYGLAAVDSADAIVLLDEHFRSHPALIDFSNHRFYEGRLKVLTDLTRSAAEAPLMIEHCPVQIEGDVNLGEVEAIFARLESLISESAELPDDECPRIGVLAFFRATALYLERELLEQFDLRTLSRHDLRVGTPYGFQGEERDIMLLATGVYPGRAAAAWTYLNRPDVFNVAVTRARHRQHVFVGEGALEGKGASLLAEYLHHAKNSEPEPLPSAAALEPMRVELISTLESLGTRCRPDYPFAGQRLDLLVLLDGRALAIDTVGAPSAAGRAWEWERYRLLERAGLELFPVSYLAWKLRREEIMAELHETLGAVSFDTEARLAGQFRTLRWRLEELRETELLALLEGLEAAYRQALHWLGQHFQPGELTYRRYRQAVERLQQAAFVELQGAAVLLEGLRDLDPDALTPELMTEVEQRVEGSRQASSALNRLVQELALLRTSDTNLEDALSEIARLADRVSLYGVAQQFPK